ncbi:MAG: PCMD domain-containing protein [Tannerella sp.]|jgi:hypothetical protein|nr:PCMD domain-containing protein [Tannerella sp.]
MTRILIPLLTGLLIASCIRKEALNTEADIVECLVDGSILKREPIIQNDKVTLMVKGNTDLTRQAPEFMLTEGATITPASGTVRDFTGPQSYIVMSEDGQWKKNYSVSYVIDEFSTLFSFEDTIPERNNRYYIFAEKNGDHVTMEWASGNIGFAITGAAKTPEDYPTTQSDHGYTGKCACLTTRSTGALGGTFKMPIAAGNLFIGTFQLDLSNPLKATRFGLPFYNTPTTFSGYYKYKAGDIYYENGNIVEGVKDRCHFYAVLYETDEALNMLDGINVFTHPNIISTAVIENPAETDEWTYFSLPFVYRPGKSIDPEKLKDGKYNLTVVFTSSMDGGEFKGAPGSTLYIDEVEITVDN